MARVIQRKQESAPTEIKPIWHKYAVLITVAGIAVSAFVGWLNYSKPSQPANQMSEPITLGSLNIDKSSHSETTINDFSSTSNRSTIFTRPPEILVRPNSTQPTPNPQLVQPPPLRNTPTTNQRPGAAPPVAETPATPEPKSPFAFDRDPVLLNFYKKLDDLRVEGAELAREVNSFGECASTYVKWEPKGIRLLQEINGYLSERYHKRVFLDQDFGTQEMGFYGIAEETQFKYCRDIFYQRASTLGNYDAMIKNALLSD